MIEDKWWRGHNTSRWWPLEDQHREISVSFSQEPHLTQYVHSELQCKVRGTCLILAVSNHKFDTLSPLTLMCQTCPFISAIRRRGKCWCESHDTLLGLDHLFLLFRNLSEESNYVLLRNRHQGKTTPWVVVSKVVSLEARTPQTSDRRETVSLHISVQLIICNDVSGVQETTFPIP